MLFLGRITAVWNDMMTAFQFWCERSLKTLDKITIKHLISYVAFHPACVQLLWSVAQFLCWFSDQYLNWLCLKVHQRSWIRAHLMCFCLHDEAIPRLSHFTFIDLPVMAIQNLDSFCSCVNKEEYKHKIPSKDMNSLEKSCKGIKRWIWSSFPSAWMIVYIFLKYW